MHPDTEQIPAILSYQQARPRIFFLFPNYTQINSIFRLGLMDKQDGYEWGERSKQFVRDFKQILRRSNESTELGEEKTLQTPSLPQPLLRLAYQCVVPHLVVF